MQWTRKFTILAGLCLAPWVLSACGDATTAAAGAPSGAHARTFQFMYEATIPLSGDPIGVLEVWVPLPLQDPGVQEVLNLTHEVRPAGAEVRETREPKYGNRMLHVRAQNPTEPLSITWTASVRRSEDLGQGTLPDNPWFLRGNDLVPLDGAARTIADNLRVANGEEDAAGRMRRVFDDVLSAMSYDKNHEGWGRGSFEHATTICKGNCTDFHARFIGTARAGGFAARFTMGIPMKPGDGSYNGYHCWAHWRDGEHWMPVDISEADKIAEKDPEGSGRFFGRLDPDRLALSVGRDITLEPPQKGSALNYFVFPYAEADGRPVKLEQNDWQFRWVAATPP